MTAATAAVGKAKQAAGRKHRPGAERRAEAVGTVLALAAEGEPGAITTAAIAERMGLTQGALFRHFPTKEAVWEAVMDWVSGELLGRLDAAAEAAGAAGALAAMEAMFLAHVDFIARHPGVPRLLFGEMQRPGETAPKTRVRALTRQYRERLASRLKRGQQTGEVGAHVDTGAAATLFIGIIQGLVMQSLMAGNTGQMRKQAPGVFAIYRRGIGGEA